MSRSVPWFVVLVLWLVLPALAQAASKAPTFAATAASATRPTTGSATVSSTAYGKETVMMSELESLYEPVPFSHRKHAQMSEMWDGCTTCHHHTPTVAPALAPTTRLAPRAHPSQDDAATVPACKSCHPAGDQDAGIRMPSLKAAYHRQCLNCHRDWMESNACVACHAAKPSATTAPTTRPLSPDDITGRMHKPLPAPTTREYVTRFTPADGARVLFRHEEHVKDFGIKCVACHRNDSCSNCHSAKPATTEPSTASRPLHPGSTWKQTHALCISCHQPDRCNHCHYEAGKTPPPPFRHEVTGQTLDRDHAKLACGDCHGQFKALPSPSCGGADCHKRPVNFPAQRPGLYKAPATTQSAAAPATQPREPATRPTLIRIRRGGQ